MHTATQEILFRYKNTVDGKIEGLLERLQGRGDLTAACGHALRGGKRFRPAIVFMVADALDREADVSEAALAVELFHTASLVADDLPSMDDDDERRNQPSVHVKYGESVALLVTYALIAEGYACLTRGGLCDAAARLLAVENVAKNTGAHGASGGQFLDLFPPDASQETLLEVLRLKTVTLFEISLVLGWIYGGGDIESLDLVKRLAHHYGMAFQIADDIDDMEQDSKNDCQVNFALAFGKDGALEQFSQQASAYRELLAELNIASPALVALIEVLEEQVARGL